MFYNNIDKLIYTCSVNGKKYDPLDLYRKLICCRNGVLNSLISQWTDKDTTDIQRATAESSIVTVTRECFAFLPFDVESGVTDGMALTALNDFLGWLEKNG
jgi:hypothetical protein